MKLIKIDPQKNYIINLAWLWDGQSPELQKDSSIVISNGIISSVRKHNLNNITNDYRDTVEIDLSDLTIIPGLIDCHVHLAFDSHNLMRTIEEWSKEPEKTWIRIEQFMKNSLSNGVLAIRDGGDLHSFNLQARDRRLDKQLYGPKIVATGTAIYKEGKYGSFLGPGISSLTEAEEQIKSLVDKNIDQLKVVISGLVSFKEFGKIGKPQFTVEELKPIVKLAHKYGLKVMAHASSDEAVAISIKAGIDSIEHGYFVSNDSLKRMAEKGIAWIPTLAPLANLVTTNVPPYPGANIDVIRRSYEQQLEALYKAVDEGVTLGVGTDAGANQVFHGTSYFDELKYYQKAGLTPLQILTAATSVSAKILSLDTFGLIKPGQTPALIGVKGNPLKDLNSIKDIEFVSYI